MKLPLAYYGNPILRQKAAPIQEITDEIRQLVKDMEETMIAHNGAGLAAPQINRSISLFLISPLTEEEEDAGIIKPARAYINPKILKYSQELWGCGQGCLSLPDPNIFGVVYRPLKITIEATDLEGKLFTEELSHLPAQAFMHENDHLNGVLFVDRLSAREREQLEPYLRRLKKKYERS